MPRKIRLGETVVVLRDISRHENKNYAKKGQTGIAVERFVTYNLYHRKVRVNVKVLMKHSGKIRTFRETSLEPQNG